ncbi:MAG: hypothetical protein AAB631_00420 [Patescibacteria group bacterium]
MSKYIGDVFDFPKVIVTRFEDESIKGLREGDHMFVSVAKAGNGDVGFTILFQRGKKLIQFRTSSRRSPEFHFSAILSSTTISEYAILRMVEMIVLISGRMSARLIGRTHRGEYEFVLG